jgi:1D-myo-inositol-tetrakisphosphate 5-kinase/inositol-polyphosphate multikinase
MPTFMGVLTLDEMQHGNRSIEQQGADLLAKVTQGNEYTNGIDEEPSAITPVLERKDTVTFAIAKHTVPEVVVGPPKPSRRITTNQAVVLGNAAAGFSKPNILDVKLGVRLYADDAHPDKKARYERVTAETTHKELGFRIAGMRVWQGSGATGKDINEEGYRIFDKNYGRYSVGKDNVHDAFKHFIFPESAGIDEELGKLITEAFLVDVKRIEEVLMGQESRMFSASLLFVFEGDGAALRSAMEEASKPPDTLTNGDGPDSEEDVEDEAGPKIYSVKVIDFAHAEWTPGQGPDENSLVGVRSVVKILENLSES